MAKIKKTKKKTEEKAFVVCIPVERPSLEFHSYMWKM